jgi:hypothetical protein
VLVDDAWGRAIETGETSFWLSKDLENRSHLEVGWVGERRMRATWYLP